MKHNLLFLAIARNTSGLVLKRFLSTCKTSVSFAFEEMMFGTNITVYNIALSQLHVGRKYCVSVLVLPLK